MKLTFSKYQGTGNDFILIDDRNKEFPEDNLELIQHLCKRKFGIGSDGLILIRKSDDHDFEMRFYNPDGSRSFCGNGSRCAMAFAHKIGMIGEEARFKAIDGTHEGKIIASEDEVIVEVSMGDVSGYEKIGEDDFINTGSPHYIKYVDQIDVIDVLKHGKAIRYNDRFKREGTNVNLVEPRNGILHVRTYERGVENETLSCGTGVTAVALSASMRGIVHDKAMVVTQGGELGVRFVKDGDDFKDIKLRGAATFVFEGEIDA